VEGRGLIQNISRSLGPQKDSVKGLWNIPIVLGEDVAAHRCLKNTVGPKSILPPRQGGGRYLNLGDRGKPHVVISKQIGEDYGDAPGRRKQVGDTLRIGGRGFTVVGIYETKSVILDKIIIMDIAAARDLLGVPEGVVSSFWLQAVSRYRAVNSGGLNFAYDLCVRSIRPDQRAELDLSSWEVAFTGAEPVHAATLDRFAEAFAPWGFRREAFYPCYGLAEATLIVSGGARRAGPKVLSVRGSALERHVVEPAAPDDPECRTLVGCGAPLPSVGVKIVDPATAVPCPPGRVGEVLVSGPSVAQGHWRRPDETFQARPDGDGEPYLRTGDLGFLHDGELFITGRLKELIIIRGRNHYPQDIERLAESSHEAIPDGR